jgi:chromosomal replication initiation ATPase DnaA
MSKELKLRAKRLRGAIADLLKQEISVAQSLELVALEENYPNWDAASASYKAPVLGETLAAPLSVHHSAQAEAGGPHGISTNGSLPIREKFKAYVNSKYPSFAAHVQSGRSGLTLFAGGTGSGKSSAMRMAAEQLFEQDPAAKVVMIGTKFQGDKPLQTRSEAISAMGRMQADIVGIDDIRSGEAMYTIMEILNTGHAVWACVHASSEESAITRCQMFLTNPNLYESSELKAHAEEHSDALLEAFDFYKTTGQIKVFYFDGQEFSA